MWDPSGLAMHAKILPRKRNVEEFEMKALLKGNQAAAIYFDDFRWRPETIDPVKIAAVIRILERTGKTPIIGARFQRSVITADDLRRLHSMAKVEQVRTELVGVLGGAAQSLAGVLSTPAVGVAFTLEGRQKAMEKDSKEIGSKTRM
jgi:ribosomal protein L10